MVWKVVAGLKSELLYVHAAFTNDNILESGLSTRSWKPSLLSFFDLLKELHMPELEDFYDLWKTKWTSESSRVLVAGAV